MLIVDGHQDIAYNAAEFGRDPMRSAYYHRKHERGSRAERLNGQCTTGLPEWLLGHVGIIFSTLFVLPAKHDLAGNFSQAYATPRNAHDLARKQLDFYRRLADDNQLIELIGNQSQLETVVESWQDGLDLTERRIGLVPLMEGADPIQRPAEVEEWFEQGVRIVGLAWDATRYAGGTHTPGGLTDLGRELLEAMNDLPIILDLSHADEPAYMEALDRFEGMTIASHSNARHFNPGSRGLSDEMIARLIERDGVVGTVTYNKFLRPGHQKGDPRELVTIRDVVAAIDHVCQIAGNAEHVAIGSDFDGGFGLENIPTGFDTIADLGRIGDALGEYGFAQDDIEKVLSGNWLRILRKALPD